MIKSQITNPKSQTITKLQDPIITINFWNLIIEYYLGIGAWDLEFCLTE